jgi:nucleotide-binding universal stress UspA family protein
LPTSNAEDTVHTCILIPTDGSEFCERAIRYGVNLARLSGAKIIGVNVTLPLHAGTPRALIPKNILDMVHTETAKVAAEKLAAVEREAKAVGLEVETFHVSDDRPWEAIVRIAKDKACDLIVMASHARRGVSAIVLGSQAHKVITHSHIPVLVVR